MPILQAVKGFFKGFQRGYTSGAASRRTKEELEKTIAKPATLNKKDEFSGIGCFFLLLLLAGGVYALWHAADERGFIPHNKLTVVTAKNWTTGEYKNCTSANIAETKDEPQIECSCWVANQRNLKSASME